MKIVSADGAPEAVGPYSQAVVSGGMVFCSGQIALGPDGNLTVGGAGEQTVMVLKNLAAVLIAAGSCGDRVAKTTVYLKNMGDFEEMNKAYADFFVEHRPARATVEVANLPKGALVEIDCIAEINEKQ